MRKRINKVEAYKYLFEINQGIDLALTSCIELERLGVLRATDSNRFRVVAEEIRAGTNHSLTEALRDYEEQDWARFGRLASRLAVKEEG